MRTLLAFVGTLCVSAVVMAQSPNGSAASQPVKYGPEVALAKLALEAHGGEKLRSMKSLVVRGSCDITTSAFNQAIPATFVIILAKEKYRIELMNPFQPIKQVYDGVNTSSAVQNGMTLPPINRIGFPLLQMVGDPAFIITPLPDDKKKKRGFRMTSPEGYHTDFYLDEKTNQIKGYDATFDVRGRNVTTSVEVDKMRAVDGVVVPEKYAQRFDTEQITVYSAFKAKEILVNSELDPDVFSTTK